MLTLFAFAVAVAALGAALGLEHRRKKAEEQSKRDQAKIKVLLGSLAERYEIKVSDWGPDFTGEDDILPRWRWVIVDADHPLRLTLDPDYDRREPEIRMLGNSPTKRDAYLDALRWIEAQAHPMIVIDGRTL